MGDKWVNFQGVVAPRQGAPEVRIYAAVARKNNYSGVEAFCDELCYKFVQLVRMILNR
jgi:hypothetical protein